MDRLDNIQKRIVIKSERAHEIGLRHRGLSGTVCEKILIKVLRKEVPELNFSTGIITIYDRKGHDLLPENISPQIDIIVYKKNSGIIEDMVIVNKKDVILTIEVKKWICSGETKIEGYNDKILKLKKMLKKPHYFVGFRHHGKTPSRILEELKADKKYFFSSPSSNISLVIRGKRIREPAYPWEKKPNYYKGELERLVSDIREFI